MSGSVHRCQEFRCIECGSDIIRIIGFGEPDLCAMCIHMPGWFRHPELRAVLDPSHDGRDPADALDAPSAQPAP
jgi:hypothetical protein